MERPIILHINSFRVITQATFCFPAVAQHDAILKVGKIAENIQTAFKPLIDASFPDQEDQRAMKTMNKKITRIKFSLGFPWEIHDTDDLDTFYKDFPDVKDEFFLYWIYAANLKWQHELLYQTDAMFDISRTSAYYSGTRNEVIIPAAIMQPPFFYGEGLPAYNYAVIGTVSTLAFIVVQSCNNLFISLPGRKCTTHRLPQTK